MSINNSVIEILIQTPFLAFSLGTETNKTAPFTHKPHSLSFSVRKDIFQQWKQNKKKKGLKWRSQFSQRSLLQWEWTLSLTWLLAGCRCQPQCVTVHTPHLSLSVSECGGWARRRFGFTVKPITHKVMGSRHVRPVTDKFIRLFSASESRRKNEKVSLQVC